ncbi:hypothetical protein KAT36_01120 [Candidatus Pacearchaeota archaeon]|nr:hypothetical protein [Candidatus Pacearchaeota archaeon]
MLDQLTTLISSETNPILTLIFFTTVIVIYSTFTFYFYRFLAKKNLIELNLNQYNQYQNQLLVKIFAAILFVIEYIILLPVLTFFWFATLSILILLLAKGLEINTILLIAAALVASVRATSYVSEDLSKDLAKMLPFTLLAISITTAGFFDAADLLSRIVEIPNLFTNIPYYLLFIVAIELIMRTGEFTQSMFYDIKSTKEETQIESTE